MRLSDIQGQERAISLLRSSLEAGRIHHAWLFTGAEGVGKETTARAFAASLLCPSPEGPEACGVCPSCKKVERRSHPDLLEILPEAVAVEGGLLAKEDLPKAPSRDLKIEQIRQLERGLSVSPVESERRVVLLLEADSMNVAAQNAFLKTLEEPPTGTVLVLVSKAGDALLPTIRSRCARVGFAPLPLDLVATLVAKEKGIDPDAARLLAALSGGSLGGALALTPKALEGRVEILESLEGLQAGDFLGLLALADTISAKGREEAQLLLEAITLFYRDVALAAERAGGERLANQDLLPLIEGAAQRGTLDALGRIRSTEEARRAIRGYALPRLAVERLLLSFVAPEAV